MHTPLLGSIFAFSLILGLSSSAQAQVDRPKPSHSEKDEAMVRLQVFLDSVNFGPGKIDGLGGEFTRQAEALYRQAQGLAGKGGATPPAGSELDLKSVDPVFITYAITAEDVQMTGLLAKNPPEQAKQKWLPYQDLEEGIAEKFHCTRALLKKLNPAIEFKEGASVKVPNVKPFELGAMKTEEAKKDSGTTDQAKATEPNPAKLSLYIRAKENLLEVHEGEKIVAAFPVTLGSDRTLSPAGEWKVKGVARLPEFRWDKKMLNEGERSANFHLLPPGPNNPVGVVWIALNKKGIGIHGTNDPETIGRAESHGCIRLANWDVVKVARMVKPGTLVTIK